MEHSMELVANLVRGRKSNGRCVYHAAAKRELVRRCLEPGVSVAGIALAHGINANLLRKWITLTERRHGSAESGAPMLLPVRTRPESVSAPLNAGHIEVVLPGGTLRVHGRVERAALELVIERLSRP
jgi:transposase-like protein